MEVWADMKQLASENSVKRQMMAKPYGDRTCTHQLTTRPTQGL